MISDRVRHDLLKKTIIAKVDLMAYLQLRKAKGYMSVAESHCLRENLFELCKEYRRHYALLKQTQESSDLAAFTQSLDALSSAAVCLMTGQHDCPLYITVDAEKLERAIATLQKCTRLLTDSKKPAEA
ncbi:biofilm formation regulator BssR [Franconibacter helveticus 513]|uniref:biofilm formation regulator BssR n=1 Tax=Franconibacter helveticus TaxID=357240 RepID=UPI000465FC44|nr:biofilm formation regulator BssR [Franconibacter helveticus]MDU6922994.1 biofilm formation regulator BssR [Franconibacter helveticus]